MFDSLTGWWHRFLERRREAKALRWHGCDVKCPSCERWMHTSQFSRAYPLQYGVYRYTCGFCDQQSDWDFAIAPLPIFIGAV
jgi:transposase-like protein